MRPNPRTGIAQAVAAAGSQQALAARLGVSQQFVSRCVKRGYAPINRAREIEAAFGVPRAALINPRIRDAMDEMPE